MTINFPSFSRPSFQASRPAQIRFRGTQPPPTIERIPIPSFTAGTAGMVVTGASLWHLFAAHPVTVAIGLAGLKVMQVAKRRMQTTPN